jgi:membrane-associated phospholipid phosphatase
MEAFFSNSVLFGEGILNSTHLFLGGWFDSFMAFVTGLGNENFYVLCIPILFWCYNKTFAARIGGAFLLSVIINDVTKQVFSNPRPNPENLAPGIRELNIRYIPHDSPGFPSGHAQEAMVFWGAFAYYLRKKTGYLVAALLILLISYSRMYLAVHYFGDVLGGLFIGCVMLLLYFVAVAWIEKKYELIHKAVLIGGALIIPYLLFKILPGYDVVKSLGVLSGFIIGIILEKEKVGFSPKSRPLPHALKLLIGFAGVVIIKSGIKPVLPVIPASDYFRYWLLGIWITLFAPLVFNRIKFLRGAQD